MPIYHTHAARESGGKKVHSGSESDKDGLTVRLEPVDEKKPAGFYYLQSPVK